MKKPEQPPSKVNIYKHQCEECGFRGVVIQRSPVRVRRCKNGHVWEDPRWCDQVKPPYVPLSKRLEMAHGDLQRVLDTLHEAEVMIRDLSDELPPGKRLKYGVQGCLHRIEQVQDQHQGDDKT